MGTVHNIRGGFAQAQSTPSDEELGPEEIATIEALLTADTSLEIAQAIACDQPNGQIPPTLESVDPS